MTDLYGMPTSWGDTPPTVCADDLDTLANGLEELGAPQPAALVYHAAELLRFLMEIAEAYDFLTDQVPLIYDHITAGRLTKTNYAASTIIAEHDEHCHAQCVDDDLADRALGLLGELIERERQMMGVALPDTIEVHDELRRKLNG